MFGLLVRISRPRSGTLQLVQSAGSVMNRHWFRLAPILLYEFSTIPASFGANLQFFVRRISLSTARTRAVNAISRASAPVSTSHFPFEPRQIRVSVLLPPPLELAFRGELPNFFVELYRLRGPAFCCGLRESRTVFGCGIYDAPASVFHHR